MIPSTLQGIIDRALEQVRAHPRHALRPFHRNEVYAYLAEPQNTPDGWRRYGELDVLTARHVLPRWQQWRDHYRLGDNRAERLLAQSESMLHNSTAVAGLAEDAEHAWNWLMAEHLAPDAGERPPRPIFSAFAAIVQAAFTVSTINSNSGERFQDAADTLASGPTEQDEDDTDPWSADVALWAAAAIACPGLWPEAVEATERLSFWTWWLTEAVPAAWEVVL